eukprot:Awhi_evm1s3888
MSGHTSSNSFIKSAVYCTFAIAIILGFSIENVTARPLIVFSTITNDNSESTHVKRTLASLSRRGIIERASIKQEGYPVIPDDTDVYKDTDAEDIGNKAVLRKRDSGPIVDPNDSSGNAPLNSKIKLESTDIAINYS